MMPGTLLFTPLTIRDASLRNRIVVPPMHQYSAIKGFPTDWHLMNAGKFAAGGAGLVVVESTKVERRGCGTVGDLGIWDDAFVEPLGRLATFIKQQNAVAGIQLGHSGRKARANRPWEGDGPLQRTTDIDDWDAWTPVAPSAIAHSDKWPVPQALELQEIKDLVQAWGEAARRAHQAGFEVLELHGAHGYLVHQFLSERSNRRTDEYGGTEPNRMRFLIEIAEAVRAHWPNNKPLFVRLSVEDKAGWERNKARGWRRSSRREASTSSTVHRAALAMLLRFWARKSNTATRCHWRNMSPRGRYYDHGGWPDHSRRPGRADPARRAGRFDCRREGNPQ
jgi:2,4-dienoyl-CoA reductase-like NADH-dependent reductase (Old Yellow Enzyme family)